MQIRHQKATHQLVGGWLSYHKDSQVALAYKEQITSKDRFFGERLSREPTPRTCYFHSHSLLFGAAADYSQKGVVPFTHR